MQSLENQNNNMDHLRSKIRVYGVEELDDVDIWVEINQYVVQGAFKHCRRVDFKSQQQCYCVARQELFIWARSLGCRANQIALDYDKERTSVISAYKSGEELHKHGGKKGDMIRQCRANIIKAVGDEFGSDNARLILKRLEEGVARWKTTRKTARALTKKKKITRAERVMNITLPWPSSILSPNVRVHWGQRLRKKKKAREAGHVAVLAALGKERDAIRSQASVADVIDIEITAYPLAASLKAFLDGVADALGIDDHVFRVKAVSVSEKTLKNGVELALHIK